MARGEQLARQKTVEDFSDIGLIQVRQISDGVNIWPKTLIATSGLSIGIFMHSSRKPGFRFTPKMSDGRKPVVINGIGQKSDARTVLTCLELMALYFGRDALKVLKGTVFYDSLEDLFQKIKATLPPESKKYLKNVEQSLKVGSRPYTTLQQIQKDHRAD